MSTKSYENDDRRRAAALAACEELPTEALERGIVKELFEFAAMMMVANHMSERRAGYICTSEAWWVAHVRTAINRLNDTCEPGPRP